MEVFKYSACEVEESPSSETNETASEEYDEDVDRNIIQQLTEFNNPFLLKALEGYIPSELLKKDTADTTNSRSVESIKTRANNLFDRYI